MGQWADSGQLQTNSISGEAQSWAEQGVTGNINGVDVSMWNTPDYVALHTSGARFAFIKASEFVSGSEAYASSHWTTTKPAVVAAGIIPGSYQYAKPTSVVANVVADATAQAQAMVARVGTPGTNELPPVLDLEYAPSALTKSALTLWANTWLATVKAQIGRTPILYSYTSFLATRLNADPGLVAFPLWQADYNVNASAPGTVTGWPISNRLFWQFSSKGQVPGYGSGSIDLDTFLGTSAQWSAISYATATPPLKPPAPAAPASASRSRAAAASSLGQLSRTLRRASRARHRTYVNFSQLRGQLRRRGVTVADLALAFHFGIGGRHVGRSVYLSTTFSGGQLCVRAKARTIGAAWHFVRCPVVAWRRM